MRLLIQRREHFNQSEPLGPRTPSTPRTRRTRFGFFEADLTSGELFSQGRKVKLRNQAFQVLALLLEHPGELVTRDEMRQRLWPSNVFVDFDLGLNSVIKRVRDALQDPADAPRFVETLPKRGYRFIAPVETAEIATNLKPEEARSAPQRRAQIDESAHWQEQVRSRLVRLEQLVERQAQRQHDIVEVLARLARGQTPFSGVGPVVRRNGRSRSDVKRIERICGRHQQSERG